MPFHPQAERFDALHQQPRVIRRDAGAEVAQRHRAGAQNERQRRKRRGQIVAPAQAVIAIVRLVVERMFARGPVEFPAIDDDAADARAMAAEPLG